MAAQAFEPVALPRLAGDGAVQGNLSRLTVSGLGVEPAPVARGSVPAPGYG